jgi:hypothetical protein
MGLEEMFGGLSLGSKSGKEGGVLGALGIEEDRSVSSDVVSETIESGLGITRSSRVPVVHSPCLT